MVRPEVLEELDKFAQKFGLAFQIYDDIMDEISTFEDGTFLQVFVSCFTDEDLEVFSRKYNYLHLILPNPP